MMTLRVYLLCVFCYSLGSAFRDKAEYPTIHQVISFKTPRQQTEEYGESKLIDIEKLDMRRIKNDDSTFRRQLLGSAGDILIKGGDITNETRRQSQRDPGPAFKNMKGLELNRYMYKVQFRTKMADVMLQLVYMCRSKIRSFETQGFIDQEASEYRVGVVIRRMENLFYKARRYFTIMVEKQNKGKWDEESTSILNLHHKVVMGHTDYVHLFFVFMKLHERLNQIYDRPLHSTYEILAK